MTSASKDGKYICSVKVGPKGQIVIPKEIRDSFGITPGQTLVILSDPQKGIAIERYETFSRIADAIFDGRSKELYPDQTEESAAAFAETLRRLAPETERKRSQ